MMTTTGRPEPFEVQFTSPQKYWNFFNSLAGADEDESITAISFFSNENRITIRPRDVTSMFFARDKLVSRHGWEPVLLTIILSDRRYQLSIMGTKRAKNIYNDLSALVGEKPFGKLFILHQEENKKSLIRLDQDLKEVYTELL